MTERTGKREQLWRSIVTRSAPTPDLELLDRWRAGKHRAGEELCRRHLETLRGFFATKCRGDADQLARRTLIASARGEEPPGELPSFRAYLFKLARRELHRHLQERRRGRVDFAIASVAEIMLPEPVAPELAAAEGPVDEPASPPPRSLTDPGSRAGSSS